jgi:predicted DNA-binding transcriptional regulator AlpA
MLPIDLPKDYTVDVDRLLVTAAEASRMLAMGKSTFWREVKNRNVPAPVKIGGLTRWRVSDLQRLVEQAT